MTQALGISSLVVELISLYQRYLSPYKGFVCARRARHKRPSCSEHGKRVFSRFGLIQGWQLLKRRFAQCRKASAMLKSESNSKKRKWQTPDACAPSNIDAADCAVSACDCGAHGGCDVGADACGAILD